MKKFKQIFITYKKLISSCVMILFTGGLLLTIGLTWGWFSQNKVVEATGMKMEISVPPNVLITEYNPPTSPDSFTLNIEDLEDYGFGAVADIKPTNALYPASFDGTTFRYATTVNPDGTVGEVDEDGNQFAEVRGYLDNLFYIEQSFYITTTYINDITIALSNVQINQGTIGGDLYKSVRCELVNPQSLELTGATYSDPIFRYAESSTDTSGQAYPANGSNSVMTTDPSIICGSQNDDVFRILIPHSEVIEAEEDESFVQLTAVKFTIRIWIEGQNKYAVVGNAGTGFFVSFDYNIYKY